MDGLGNRRRRWKLAGGRTLALDLDGGGGERMDSRGRQASNKQGDWLEPNQVQVQLN